MKLQIIKPYTIVAAMLATASFMSCQKNLVQTDSMEALPMDGEAVTATVSSALQGRALAANCFQCHGTNGYASELKIAGINASALLSKFSEMKARGARDNIMNVHAFAYTNAEIQLIGDFFSKQ